MKPKISDIPTHACGVRSLGWGVGVEEGGCRGDVDDDGEAAEGGVSPMMPISPGAVGVRGGSLEAGSTEPLSGSTGPGMEFIISPGSDSSRRPNSGA